MHQAAIADKHVIAARTLRIRPVRRFPGAQPHNLGCHAVVGLLEQGFPDRLLPRLHYRLDRELHRSRSQIAARARLELFAGALILQIRGLRIPSEHTESHERESLRPRCHRAVSCVVILELDRERLQHLAAAADRSRACDEELEHRHAMEVRDDRLVCIEIRHGGLRPRRMAARAPRPEEDGPPMLIACPGGNDDVSFRQRISSASGVDHVECSLM